MLIEQIVVSSEEQHHVLQAVADERARQDLKWGITTHPLDTHFRVLAEEFGEVAKALNEREHLSRVIEELVHTAACCVKMAEDIMTHHGKA